MPRIGWKSPHRQKSIGRRRFPVRKELEFLKKALNRSPNGGVFSCYHIGDGRISAQNEFMQASTPFDSADKFSVAGDELEAAFSRISNEPRIEYKENKLVVQAGRIRASIPCVSGEPPPMFQQETEWKSLSSPLTSSLKKALPFLIGTGTGWTTGIRLMTGRITTLNNRSGVDIALPDWESPPVLITKEASEFLISQDQPDEYAVLDGAVRFRWEDGGCAQIQLIDQQMPASIEQIFAKAGQNAPVEITPEWREAFKDAEAVADGTIEVCKNFIRVTRGASKVTVDAEIDVDTSHVSFWEAKVLVPMLACATHWNPLDYPKPCLFQGPGLYGVVLGVKGA